METKLEYLRRYLTWLRIQKGKRVSKETAEEIQQQIKRVKSEIIQTAKIIIA